MGNTNCSKRCICLDLMKEEGRAALLKLVETADVLVYNVRPQAMARLDLGYEACAKLNPCLIDAGVFGIRQAGPYAAKPAYHDLIAIVLIDTAEGFRMMAHGALDLAIGVQVSARYVRFTGRLVPLFERIVS